MVENIKDADHMKQIIENAGDKLIVIDFFATWCGPCKMIAPKIDQLAEELKGVVYFVKVDVDEIEDLSTEYGIDSMPTFVFIKNKERVEKFSGSNFDKLKQTVEQYK